MQSARVKPGSTVLLTTAHQSKQNKTNHIKIATELRTLSMMETEPKKMEDLLQPVTLAEAMNLRVVE
jgi:hypothetical protein